MSDRFGRPITRHGAMKVRITHGDEVLHGVLFREFPIDVPPVVEVPSIDLTLYLDIWERRGWTVHEIEEAGN